MTASRSDHAPPAVSAARDPLRVTIEALSFAVLPLLLLVAFMVFWPRDQYAWDFHSFWDGAVAVAHGGNPYASAGMSPAGRPYDLYMYPPLLADLLVPLGLLPFMTAAVIFVSASALAIAAALRLLGVRDWRCYGAAFLWFPVLHGLGLGALTPVLVLAVAACWRFRERGVRALSLAATVVSKLFLWPLLVWEAGRSGFRSGLRAAAAALVLTGISWATVGFAGLWSYPSLLRSAESNWEAAGYGFGALLRDAGLSAPATFLLLVGGLLSSAALVLVAARRGLIGDRESLALVVGIACTFSPAAWLHYWALLLVPVALFSPSLGPAWFVPLALWATPVEESDGTPWRLGLGLLVIWGTIAACLWSRQRSRGMAHATGGTALGTAAPSGADGWTG